MSYEPSHALSPKVLRLAEKLRDARYRKAYLGAHIKQFLARQMRALRGSDSQAEFGAKIDKAQTIVSRYEDPAYGKWTLSSLLEVANNLNLALIVRFVDYPTFLKFTDDMSEEAASPEPYNQKKTDAAAWDMATDQTLQTINFRAFLAPPSQTQVADSNMILWSQLTNQTNIGEAYIGDAQLAPNQPAQPNDIAQSQAVHPIIAKQKSRNKAELLSTPALLPLFSQINEVRQ